MKVVLDLDQSLKDGEISSEEYSLLKENSQKNFKLVAINLLVCFGAIAMSEGVMLMTPSLLTSFLIGGGSLLMAIGLSLFFGKRWRIAFSLLVIFGVVTISNGLGQRYPDSHLVYLFLPLFLGGFSLIAKSAFLAFLSVPALGNVGMLIYDLFFEKEQDRLNLFFLFFFLLLFVFFYKIQKKVSAEYRRLASVAAKSSLIYFNFLFFNASYSWAPSVEEVKNSGLIPTWGYSIAWAIVLLVQFYFAIKSRSIWYFYMTSLFAAAHFFIQWYEFHRLTAISLIGLGLLGILIAFVFRKIQSRFQGPCLS